jgi:hypothetical protein
MTGFLRRLFGRVRAEEPAAAAEDERLTNVKEDERTTELLGVDPNELIADPDDPKAT